MGVGVTGGGGGDAGAAMLGNRLGATSSTHLPFPFNRPAARFAPSHRPLSKAISRPLGTPPLPPHTCVHPMDTVPPLSPSGT